MSHSKSAILQATVATSLGLFVCLVGNLAYGQSTNGSASQPSAPSSDKPGPTSEQSKLVDGLLDLLDEPASSKKEVKPAPLSQPQASEKGKAQDETNTLSMVRKQMDMAASLLQEGKSDRETVDLQASIVSQLDQLIAQIEQQQKNSQKSSKQRTQQSMQQQVQQNSQQKRSAKEKENSPSSHDKDNSEAREKGSSPGNQGEIADASLQRNNPTALQQNVWGHLPERVRSQMQSRMVEEFLPAYREHIEAYYRALLEEGNKK